MPWENQGKVPRGGKGLATRLGEPPPPHRGMFPEMEDVLHVLQRMQQEVVTPFLPVDGHGAITVHAGGDRVGTESVPGAGGGLEGGPDPLS